MKRSEIGIQGEEIAAKYLTSKGFVVISRNYRRPWGEIDIVATRGETVHFVEVKSSQCEPGGFSRENAYDPLEHADTVKLRKVSRTAQVYMNSTQDNRPFQVDVVAVYLDIKRKLARCHYYPQVLE